MTLSLPEAGPGGLREAWFYGAALWVVNADGTGARRVLDQLPRSRTTSRSKIFSPDSSRVAILQGEQLTIASLQEGGTSNVDLTEPLGPDRSSSLLGWSADGSEVLPEAQRRDS